MLSINGFTIVEVETEYQGFREYSLVPDMRVIIEYNNEKYVVFVEVDLTKGFTSEEKYYQVFKNMKNLKEQIPYKVLLVSVCDKPFATNYVNPIRLKTDFSDFNRLIWKFVR
jgi:mRNA-degrading endonuclease YafQ of YafQ-DinJ toxin-antitoxin module